MNGSSLLVFSCPVHAIFLPTQIGRRLGYLSSDSGDANGYSASLATMSATTSQYYKTNDIMLSTSNSSTRVGSGILYACVGGTMVLFLLLLLFVFVGYRPRLSAKSKRAILSTKEVDGGSVVEKFEFSRMGATFHPKMNFSVHNFSSECWLLEQSMPYVFNRAVNLTDRLLHILTIHHRWVRLTAHGCGNGKHFWSTIFPSGCEIALPAAVSERMILALHIIVFFFFQCLFLFSMDSESACDNIYNERTCIKTMSASLSGDNICHWNVYPGAANALYGYCTYIQPVRRLNTLIYIALYSALCSVLVSALNQFIIRNVIIFPNWIKNWNVSLPANDSKAELPDQNIIQTESERILFNEDNPTDSVADADIGSLASADRKLNSIFQEKSIDEYSLHSKGDLILLTLVRDNLHV